jgi:hypothetical protein
LGEFASPFYRVCNACCRFFEKSSLKGYSMADDKAMKTPEVKVLYTVPHASCPASCEASYQVVAESKETGWRKFADGHDSTPLRNFPTIGMFGI